MNLNPTPTERLLLALLQIKPGLTEQELFLRSGSKAPKYIRASLRSLLLAGRISATDSQAGTIYKAAERGL